MSQIDTAPALAKLLYAEKQVDFATARALTWTAKGAAADFTRELPKILDKPTPFTQRGIAAIPAKKATLEAFVLVKDLQAQYLAYLQTGETRKPQPGRPINVPVGRRVNRYGNIPKGAIARELQREDTFFASGRDEKTRHLPPGIYRRPKRGTRRSGARGRVGKPLKLLVAAEKQADYDPILDMHRRVGKSVARRFGADFARSLDLALKSAR